MEIPKFETIDECESYLKSLKSEFEKTSVELEETKAKLAETSTTVKTLKETNERYLSQLITSKPTPTREDSEEKATPKKQQVLYKLERS